MTEWDPEENFDQELADSYVGKYVLIGLTYVDPNGEVIEQVQMHGVIDRAEPTGITVSLRGNHSGEEYVLPPDLDAFDPADPGIYRLRSTGESIEDPEFLASWTVQRPPQN